ncbi:hypothetical protein CIHG_07873 [Coccidioides immitis H538.4]|uniref:Uncharacterized protein n=1 Tax=Coccidioides immitis H538.4 TaxID=396776 RepID=A0A0J8S133_COCIT|nr:hypothetical protein CIHG_07873 [Coccidioides immitis H538.4]
MYPPRPSTGHCGDLVLSVRVVGGHSHLDQLQSTVALGIHRKKGRRVTTCRPAGCRMSKGITACQGKLPERPRQKRQPWVKEHPEGTHVDISRGPCTSPGGDTQTLKGLVQPARIEVPRNLHMWQQLGEISVLYIS